jgi:hypothetical protein
LTHFLTINVHNTRCKPEEASAAFSKLRSRRFARWFKDAQKRLHARRKRKAKKLFLIPPTYTWAIERPFNPATKTRTCNIHWAVHLPDGLKREFYTQLRRWIEIDFGGIKNNRYVTRKDAITNPIGLKRYFSKGVSAGVARGRNIRHSDQGTVVGRRSGFSENLGTKVRQTPEIQAALKAAHLGMRDAVRAGHPVASNEGTAAAEKAGREAYEAAGGRRRY